MTCETVRDNLDGWALGALDHEEARDLEKHLAGCTECTMAADSAREGAAALAMAVPLHAASSSLKARVMAGAAALQKRPRRQSRPAYRYWPAAAASVAIIGLGIGGWGVNMQNDINNLEDSQAVALASASTAESQYATVSTQLVMASDANSSLAQSQDAVTEIVSAPDATRLAMESTAAAPGSSGRYVWSRAAGMGSLVARDLPALQEEKTYCFWLIFETDWILAGTFDVDAEGTGRLIVDDLDVAAATGEALVGYAVSLEARGDITQHTGEVVLRASVP